MLTFLPFSRSVKARTRALAVCAALLGMRCVGGRTTPHPEGPPPQQRPAPDADAAHGAEPSSHADAGARETVTPLAAIDSTTPSVPSVTEVTIELPYALDARPRAASAKEAAVEDEALARWNVGGAGDATDPSSGGSYHPGTRVVVDTRLAKHRPGNPFQVIPKRGLTLERVQAQTRSRGYWPFRLCFEAGQRGKKSAGGETRVAFTIGLRGKVSRAWLLDSKLGSSNTAACLVHETSKLEFTPHPARPLAMVASIKVWPGDAELPASPELTNTAVTGGFEPETVRARVADKLADVTACFADARRGDPALWGRLALATILEVDGTVHRVSEVESHFPNAAAAHCVEMVLAGIPFPSVSGKAFTMVVPLRLSPPVATMGAGPELSPSPQEATGDAGSD